MTGRGEQSEEHESELAQLGTASSLDTARVSVVQLGQIQARRTAFGRRPAQYVRSASSSLHVLLEAVLLYYIARRQCRMSLQCLQTALEDKESETRCKATRSRYGNGHIPRAIASNGRQGLYEYSIRATD